MSVIEDAEAREALRELARAYHKELVADRAWTSSTGTGNHPRA